MTLRALLRPLPVQVAVGPLTVTVAAGWADAWLVALEGGRLDSVVPGMIGEADREELADALVSGAVTKDDIATAAQQAITEAGARPWWETARLVSLSAASEGAVATALVMQGLRPAEVTIGMWCTAVVSHVVPRMDEMTRMRFEGELRIPPGGSVRDLKGFDGVQF